MRRVCFLTGDIGRSGGTERVTTVIASNLAARGFDVSILSLARGEAAFFPVDSAVQLHSLHMERYSANFSDLRLCWRLRKFLREKAIERVVDVDTILSLYSIPAAWGTKARVFSWEHFHLGINVGGWPQRLRRYAGRRLAARAAASIVTLSERDKHQYTSRLNCRAPVVNIPNPFTISHQERSILDGKVVLAAGRLVPEKGFDLLLKAWAEIAHQHAQWTLRIVGSGQQDEFLKSMATEYTIGQQVEFVPHTSDMTGEFLSASIFASASRYEGFGLTIVEAKSFGLPVVSFDCDCGPAEIVRHEKDGLLVQHEDSRALATALDRLIRSSDDRETFAKAALQDKRFELSRIMPQWERLLA